MWTWATSGVLRVRVRSAIFLMTMLVAVAAAGVAAASQQAPIVPRYALVGGRSYSQWMAAYWRWRDSLHRQTASNATCLTPPQHGPVWFLGGSDAASVINCSIPAGRYIMFSGPVTYCSTANKPPYHASTDAGLVRCARNVWGRTPGILHVTLDGVALQPPGYIVRTSAFRFRMPAYNNNLLAPGRTRGREADIGYTTILRPLTPGTHTVIAVGRYEHYPHPAEKVTFVLTVGPA